MRYRQIVVAVLIISKFINKLLFILKFKIKISFSKNL